MRELVLYSRGKVSYSSKLSFIKLRSLYQKTERVGKQATKMVEDIF